MRLVKVQVAAVVVAGLALAGSAFSQHGFDNTRTVDPSGSADFTTIQAAIDNFGAVSDRHTVLIYAGTYDESITLDGDDENIDLVGIDRESVIISVSGTDENGITITSGPETSRNNRIANLTIITTDGHGIEIVKPMGAQTPKDIQIEGVTILADGTDKIGIEGSAADTVCIFDCDIESANGNGVDVGDNFEIISSVLRSQEPTNAREALHMAGKDGLLVSNCTIAGVFRGLLVSATSLNIQVSSSEIRGGIEGMYVSPPGENVRFRDCYIVGEGNSSTLHTFAVYLDFNVSTSDAVFQGCRIEALGGVATENVVCVQIDNTENSQFIDCDFRAVCLNADDQARVNGIRCVAATVFVIGGSIQTSQPDFDKSIDVFDLVGDTASSTADHIFISGTRFSKWVQPINAAGRPRSVMQRTISVDDEVTDVILEATALTLDEQDNVTPTNQPDVYRVLSVTGNAFGMDQVVYIVGTDWADNDIVDKIMLSGTSTVDGFKPFKTVDHIILPAQTSGGQTVKVGTTNKLGLHYPISAGRDVLQQARKASAASSYTLETLESADVDKVYSTILIDTITDGDSFQWALLTGR